MCGRYVMARSTGDLVAAFDVAEPFAGDIQPSYNVAPTDEVPLIIERKSADGSDSPRELATARWGLVPSWSKDPKGGARLINARMETVTGKPSFRQAAARRRALVVA
ncbi:MAG TPA: SOS response-associated peptidase family protein, partial [Micrococcaceae bacterium]